MAVEAIQSIPSQTCHVMFSGFCRNKSFITVLPAYLVKSDVSWTHAQEIFLILRNSLKEQRSFLEPLFSIPAVH